MGAENQPRSGWDQEKFEVLRSIATGIAAIAEDIGAIRALLEKREAERMEERQRDRNMAQDALNQLGR